MTPNGLPRFCHPLLQDRSARERRVKRIMQARRSASNPVSQMKVSYQETSWKMNRSLTDSLSRELKHVARANDRSWGTDHGKAYIVRWSVGRVYGHIRTARDRVRGSVEDAVCVSTSGVLIGGWISGYASLKLSLPQSRSV